MTAPTVAADRLDAIEQRLNQEVPDVSPRRDDERWLINEVRRMRAEQSDHTAAKYWRQLQAARATIARITEFHRHAWGETSIDDLDNLDLWEQLEAILDDQP